MHPVNLGLRFLLELAALAALAIWGRAQAFGPAGLLCMIGAPGIVVAVWSTFTVPGDPSRGDGGLVAVPGWLRLLLELTVFTLSAVALYDLGRADLAAALAAATLMHYGLSYRRLHWLLRGP
jgi:hypothetical protein